MEGLFLVATGDTILCILYLRLYTENIQLVQNRMLTFTFLFFYHVKESTQFPTNYGSVGFDAKSQIETLYDVRIEHKQALNNCVCYVTFTWSIIEANLENF